MIRTATFWQPACSRRFSSATWFARPANAWSPLDLANLQLWLPTHLLRALWRTPTNQTEEANASADGQTITQLDDQGPYAHRVVAAVGREPVLGSDVDRHSYLALTPDDFLTLDNSNGALRWLHNGSAFTVLVWFRVASGASSNGVILDSAHSTSAGTTGFSLRWNSSGTVFSAVHRAASGHAISHTSTATIGNADGWTLVGITFDGASTATMRLFTQGGTVVKATESMSVTGGFDSGDATDNLDIGVRSDTHTLGFEGNLADVVLLSGVIGDAELDLLRAWNPARTTTSPGRVLGSYATLGAAAVSGLAEWHDFGDRSTQWQDAVGGTAVTLDDDPIGVVQNKLPVPSSVELNRDFAYDGTASARPLSKDAVNNGSARPAAQFDGGSAADDNLSIPSQPSGAASTWIYVVRNLDANFGSHYSRASGNQYLVKTGSNYEGGGTNEMRVVVHTSGALAPNDESPHYGKEGGIGEEMPGGGEVWEIVTVRRDGKTWDLRWNGLPAAQTFQNDGGFAMSQLGPAVNADFELDGYIGCRLRYTHALSDAQAALVEAGLAAEWGITLPS